MKTKIFCLTIVLSLLTGCGAKESYLSSAGGVVYNNGIPTSVSEHTGTTASVTLSNGDKVNIYTCVGPDGCMHQNSGVGTDTMTKYNKAMYLTMYFDTYLYMYMKQGDKYIEGSYNTNNENPTDLDSMVSTLYSIMENIDVTSQYTYAVFNDCIKINSSDVKVRTNEIIIPSIFRITNDAGKFTMTEVYTLADGTTMGKASDTSYDYYTYNGIIIQLAKGNILESYIEVIKND